MSAFDDMTAAADAAVVGAFGDKARITPRVKGRYTARSTDPARSAFDVCGVFSLTSGETIVVDQGVGPRMSVTGHTAEFWIAADNLPAEMPREGDLLTFKGVSYNIASAPRTDRDDANLILTIED